MIIILGPDHSGKTTLSEHISLSSPRLKLHYTYSNTYHDYIKPLSMHSLPMLEAVCDRFFLCEYPYAKALDRKFQFDSLQWANMLRLTLMHNPVFVLARRKAPEYEDDYVPESKWKNILDSYIDMLTELSISFIPYDFYMMEEMMPIILAREEHFREDIQWWMPMWAKGVGAVGSPHPKVLLVAERLGPNNLNLIPFETGPTAWLLHEMLMYAKTPPGQLAITNMVKAERRSTRAPNVDDQKLLEIEITNMKPEGVVFMGAVAKKAGEPVAKSLGVKYADIPHVGWLNHRKADEREKSKHYAVWAQLWNELTGKKQAQEKSSTVRMY